MGDNMKEDHREAVKVKIEVRRKAIEEEEVDQGREKESSIVALTEWTECETEDCFDADVDDGSLFSDVFPLIADLSPCLSSSSSSSCSTTAANCTYSTISSSSSSSSSGSYNWWTVKKSDYEEIENKQHAPTATTFISNIDSLAAMAPCDQTGSEGMDVLVQLGDDLDLLDSTTDIWDPSSLLPDGEDDDRHLQNQQYQPHKSHEQTHEGSQLQPSSEDLSMVFFEWLKSNKKSISPEDLRSIKLKRSTIESAARRLGGGREGMLQLLKLILAWVKNHHLQKTRRGEDNSPYPAHTLHDNNTNVKIRGTPNPCPCLSAPSNPCWVPISPYPPLPDSAMPCPPLILGMQEQRGYLQQLCTETGIVGDCGYTTNATNRPLPLTSSDQMLDPTASLSHFGVRTTPFMGLSALGNNRYANNALFQTPECLMRLGSPNPASVTKEARKKRMARQKRFLSHQHRHHHQGSPSDQAKHVNDSYCTSDPTTTINNNSIDPHSNCVCWPLSSSAEEPITVDSMQHIQPHFQRQISSDKRQGWKSEKNLKFLLQKVLKQSDVGNLGRIVLPKKEAETHLPELEARDGISIAMEDIGTSRVWNMRYRFWPNNKSRMYLLENTGDFVRSNGLREGDFIVIYSDIKCGKYMIRGVKVRKPEVKMEGKIRGRPHKQQHPSPTSVAVNLTHSHIGSSGEASRASSVAIIMESVT